MEAIEYYYKGIEEYERQCYAEAVKYFEQSNQVEEHFKTCEMLFCCWKELSDIEKALACIEKAYHLNPNNDKTAYMYAEASVESGNKDLALNLLSEILHRNSTYKKAAELYDTLLQQEYLPDIEIAKTAIKEALLYPTGDILYDLYAIPSHNHQAYYAIVFEEDGKYKMVYAKTEIHDILSEEPIKMYTFEDATTAKSKPNSDGRIIIGMALPGKDFVDTLRDISINVSAEKKAIKDGVTIDGVFQVIRAFKETETVKEIVYEDVETISVLKNDRDYKAILENMYLTVEKIIS